MKRIIALGVLIICVGFLSGCSSKCEIEPIVEQNQKLIVPPNFGQMPK